MAEWVIARYALKWSLKSHLSPCPAELSPVLNNCIGAQYLVSCGFPWGRDPHPHPGDGGWSPGGHLCWAMAPSAPICSCRAGAGSGMRHPLCRQLAPSFTTFPAVAGQISFLCKSVCSKKSASFPKCVFSCIFNKGHSVFTGKGNQYRFIIYKGSHWSVTTCGWSTQQVSFAASSVRWKVPLPSASAQPEGRWILSHFLLPRALRWGWQEPTALPRAKLPATWPGTTARPFPAVARGSPPLSIHLLVCRSVLRCAAVSGPATKALAIPAPPCPSLLPPALVLALASTTLAFIYLKLCLHTGHPLGKFPVAVSPQPGCIVLPESWAAPACHPAGNPPGQGWGVIRGQAGHGAPPSPGKSTLGRANQSPCGRQRGGWVFPWRRVSMGRWSHSPRSGCPLLQPQPRPPDIPPLLSAQSKAAATAA